MADKSDDVQARQKAGKWGHDRGFRWVSRERLDELCTRHSHIIIRRKFFGRMVTVVEDVRCRYRAMVRKGVKGRAPANFAQPIEKPEPKRRRKVKR